MTTPEKTFELRIRPTGNLKKERLCDWLLANGIETFVEAAVDVDIDFDYEKTVDELFENQNDESLPVIIYRYSESELKKIADKLISEFGDRIDLGTHSMATKIWQDGWKDSFKPFSTKRFAIQPPWSTPSCGHLQKIVIEPGMAFGTGQHATTRLCLELLEDLPPLNNKSALDIGTGTGILAIGAAHLGCDPVTATDTDIDAVTAAAANFVKNKVKVDTQQTSIPADVKADVIFANILFVVLAKLIPDIREALLPGGYLIASGVLAEEEHEMIHLANQHGLQHVSSRPREGWVGILFTR